MAQNGCGRDSWIAVVKEPAGAIDDWRVACEWVKEYSRHGCRYTISLK